ncbi:hypothetical protein MOQ72_13455 [Saccharopolyspora sp. K220]|uniref:hypothetical protein n=1 Tax=Saccharopolyspora soli TaxID=2926618 RepID=UPI001F56048D|nr:hypothetical protein [Saccharopolyspora soli]MCI2418439.1 hypothetical protein [Saccharopolyspora soli]
MRFSPQRAAKSIEQRGFRELVGMLPTQPWEAATQRCGDFEGAPHRGAGHDDERDPVGIEVIESGHVGA